MSNLVILGVDPRAHADAKIIPPAPLPYVSRRSLARVADRLDPPTVCNCCGGPVKLTRNRDLYGKDFGEWPFGYLCQKCKAYVGLHPKTDLPLGILADRATRNARKMVKDLFMSLVAERFDGDRNTAYWWLADALNIERTECHFGMFDIETCRSAWRAIGAKKRLRK